MMTAQMNTSVKIVTVIGFVLGAVFGMAGTFVTARNLQAASWAIDGVGLIVATALLALQFFRKGNDIVADGIFVFASGSSVMLIGTATSLEGSVPSFGAGTPLWCAALLLTSVPMGFAVWVRILGIIGSVLFATTAARIFWGERVLPTSLPALEFDQTKCSPNAAVIRLQSLPRIPVAFTAQNSSPWR
jgi:hypothetical protein